MIGRLLPIVEIPRALATLCAALARVPIVEVPRPLTRLGATVVQLPIARAPVAFAGIPAGSVLSSLLTIHISSHPFLLEVGRNSIFSRSLFERRRDTETK